jgi:hypothetical protein
MVLQGYYSDYSCPAYDKCVILSQVTCYRWEYELLLIGHSSILMFPSALRPQRTQFYFFILTILWLMFCSFLYLFVNVSFM